MRWASMIATDSEAELEDRLRRVESLHPGSPGDYLELAVVLAAAWSEAGSKAWSKAWSERPHRDGANASPRRRTRRVGLGGGQGAGKSTLARLIESACEERGLRTCVLGLDDFYLTRDERRALASRVHPLFKTRGPAGTHDIVRCRAAMDALAEEAVVSIPVFDKALDDRADSRRLEGPFDLVLIEGWCVGAAAASAESLVRPINALEREDDPAGEWRFHANEALAGEYASLWSTLDELVFLQVPGLDAVRRWRLQQEEARPADRRLGREEIDRFVEHYERVTRSTLESLPAQADWRVELAEDHSVARLERRTA